MDNLPDNFFISSGLGVLVGDQKEAAERRVLEELDLKMGDKLSNTLTEEQFLQLEHLASQDDSAKTDAWLERNCPGYEQIIEAALEEVKKEILADPQKFLAA